MPDYGTETVQFAGSGAATVAALGDAFEVPFNADITDVVLTAGTAPTGADLVVDIFANGTSVFATALGVVGATANAQTGSTGGIALGDATFLFDATDGSREVQAGEVILIDTEKMLVTDVKGSSQVSQSGARGLYTVSVTRAYDGTSAAVHAAGASVFPAKPFIPAGATASGAEDQPYVAISGLPPIAKGAILTAAITQVGSSVAGANVQAEVVLTQR